MDRKYVLTALGYAIVGLLLGIYMAASKNHGQLVTHAHIMLVGFVVSFIYAVLYKNWLPDHTGRLVVPQYWLHQLGTIVLLAALFCLYSGLLADSILGPILGVSSISILASMILMKIMFIQQTNKAG